MGDWLFEKFVERKIQTTLCLRNSCDGTYGDISLILCAAISAMSSCVWPGKGFDRKKFIELLVTYTPITKTISIPRLAAGYTAKGMTAEESLFESKYKWSIYRGRVYIGTEIDLDEGALMSFVGSESHRKFIREYSYASLLYSQIRCSYSHEFKSGEHSDPTPMTSLGETCISYVNDVDSRYPYIHFGLEWLANICLTLARTVDQLDTGLAIPDTWWIDTH